MQTREQVIEGMNGIHAVACGMGNDACYLNSIGIKQLQTLLNDATALLRSQEPRVLTLEEVEEGKPYWLDMRGIASEYAICKMNDRGDSAFLDFAVQYGNKTLESNGYGKTWRCWTSRPTDEQREAVKWDG